MTILEHEIPPLASGDNLTREDFLRIWEMHPEIKKAELIGGVVYMPSPVSRDHGVCDSHAGTWLGVYSAATRGTESGHNTTSLIDEDTAQPDIFLRVLQEYGGGSWLEGRFIAGIPELLAEIVWSSASYDLHQKLELYEAAAVPEYLAILLYEKEVRWHFLHEGRYQLLAADADGIHRSRVFPGLWLDGAALLRGDMTRVLAVLQQGLAAAEHEAFVRELASRRLT